ncbi:MAG: SUMF1/EgtB/PvdO family nonheme iron enzyme, partial [Pseudomonadota bacterium]
SQMIPHPQLAALHQLHDMLVTLLESVPEKDTLRSYGQQSPPLAWLFGRAVYLELYWLRERVADDADLTGRVRPIFADEALPLAERVSRLPPRDHLLNWALEVFDEHLMRLANPAMLPDHPLLREGWLVAYLIQVLSRYYEQMVVVLVERRLGDDLGGYQVHAPLVPRLPRAAAAEVTQGHFRIGAREGVVFDNEQPVMMVELSSFRIQADPVSNTEFLAFLVDGGYGQDALWSADGDAWRRRTEPGHPHHWRRDAAGRWFGVGVNGPADLLPDEPAQGINAYEAEAFANWAAAKGEGLQGAVLQHEFQWEVAARHGHLGSAGKTWEWCSNILEPYDGYVAPEDAEMATPDFDGRHRSLRGAALQTPPHLRRASYRHSALPMQRNRLSGARLVLPPA